MSSDSAAVPVPSPVVLPVELADALAEALEYRDYLAWVLWAWGVLAVAGEGSADLREWADVEDLIGMAAVARSITRVAQVLGDASGADADVPDLLGDGEWCVSELELGRYCERHDIHTGQLPESATELLSLAVTEREPAVRATLLQLVGESRLFASMRQIVEPHRAIHADDDDESGAAAAPHRLQARDGLVRATWQPDFSDVAMDSAVNHDLAHTHRAAFEWLLHG